MAITPTTHDTHTRVRTLTTRIQTLCSVQTPCGEHIHVCRHSPKQQTALKEEKSVIGDSFEQVKESLRAAHGMAVLCALGPNGLKMQRSLTAWSHEETTHMDWQGW